MRKPSTPPPCARRPSQCCWDFSSSKPWCRPFADVRPCDRPGYRSVPPSVSLLSRGCCASSRTMPSSRLSTPTDLPAASDRHGQTAPASKVTPTFSGCSWSRVESAAASTPFSGHGPWASRSSPAAWHSPGTWPPELPATPRPPLLPRSSSAPITRSWPTPREAWKLSCRHS